MEVSGTTAPVESVTRPVIRADWAKAAVPRVSNIEMRASEWGMASPFLRTRAGRLTIGRRFPTCPTLRRVAGLLFQLVELRFQNPHNRGGFWVGVEIRHFAR